VVCVGQKATKPVSLSWALCLKAEETKVALAPVGEDFSWGVLRFEV